LVDISLEYARKVRRMKEELNMYVEIQTFLPRLGEDPAVFEHAVQVSKEANSMSLLDDQMEVVEKLAPYTVNVHIKDMAVEEYPEGFLLSEVPLGEGMLDVKRIVWATFPDRPGIYLARALAMVRANKPRKPLPRITGLTPEGRAKLEADLIERSIVYARDHLGLV
jgi:hypothetical protein